MRGKFLLSFIIFSTALASCGDESDSVPARPDTQTPVATVDRILPLPETAPASTEDRLAFRLRGVTPGMTIAEARAGIDEFGTLERYVYPGPREYCTRQTILPEETRDAPKCLSSIWVGGLPGSTKDFMAALETNNVPRAFMVAELTEDCRREPSEMIVTKIVYIEPHVSFSAGRAQGKRLRLLDLYGAPDIDSRGESPDPATQITGDWIYYHPADTDGADAPWLAVRIKAREGRRLVYYAEYEMNLPSPDILQMETACAALLPN